MALISEQQSHPADDLRFLYELGVTEALEDIPGSLLKPVPMPASVRIEIQSQNNQVMENQSSHPFSPSSVASPQAMTASVSETVKLARELADTATDLEGLKSAIRSFDGCALKKTANSTVIARGNPESDIMLVGEAPGAEEDRQGIPFCGASGQLLDKMLSCIGLNEKEHFYISNTIFWRPPGNRKPTPEEIAICRPFIEKHIQLISPKLIILVGGTATNSLLQRTEGITRLRGKKYTYKNTYIEHEIPTYVIFHPSYLLRQPAAKKTTWQDLLQIKQALSV